MSAEVARRRYLQRHIEPGLPACPGLRGYWRNTLVIPAYRETPALLQRLQRLPAGSGRTLVILVLNRPDTDTDPNANAPLRQAALALPACEGQPGEQCLRSLNGKTDLYLHDLEQLCGPSPAPQGVGLARKTGCDIAFKWMSQGAITGRWLFSTDADASLPPDYFQRLDTIPGRSTAAVFPFRHGPGADSRCDRATALYELRLHHYVLGLEYAGSPYAFHTVGSSLAVTFDGYAGVRGFPRRAGAEDFYLLNKLAKLAPIVRLAGSCIELESRESARVPFGTGPAVAKISAAPAPLRLPLFYHPACFDALRCLLATMPALRQVTAPDPLEGMNERLRALGLAPELALCCEHILQAMGLSSALEHCRRQGASEEQFSRQFHQWFDAFRTLKFIHGVRDAGWPLQSLETLASLGPRIWPGDPGPGVEYLRGAIMRHWNWTA